MAYGKRAYRSNRRYNYKGRKLSNKRVYGNRSARAQAGQIAALRNKINRVWNHCKPEIKTVLSTPVTASYTSQTAESYYKFYPIVVPSLGDGDNNRVGNFIRVINGVVYLTMEYFNSSSTGYYNAESSGCQVRVIIGQYSTSMDDSLYPSIMNLFASPNNTGANYIQMAISPLREGITSDFKILKDYKRVLTSDNNQKILKIPFKPKLPYVFSADESGSNLVRNCWVGIIVTGLHYDSNFTETVKITQSSKLVFTDA